LICVGSRGYKSYHGKGTFHHKGGGFGTFWNILRGVREAHSNIWENDGNIVGDHVISNGSPIKGRLLKWVED
jgi:hypothetical protein